LFVESVTARSADVAFEATTVMPRGTAKRAFVPTPSTAPGVLPVSVVTTPNGSTARIAKFPVSATKVKPVAASTATPWVVLKAPGTPSAKPTVEPANVVTWPPAETARIL
jgi:hypothetical protein